MDSGAREGQDPEPSAEGEFLGLHYTITNPQIAPKRMEGRAADLLEQIWTLPPPEPLTMRCLGYQFAIKNLPKSVEFQGKLKQFLREHDAALLSELPTEVIVRAENVNLYAITAAVLRDSSLIHDRQLMLKFMEQGADHLVTRLVTDSPELTDPRYEGHYVPLHLAAWTDCDAILDAVLHKKRDINVVGSYGMTALHWAAANASPRMVDRLLNAGAGLELENDWSMTPMDVALVNGRDEAAAILRSRGAAHDERGFMFRILTAVGAYREELENG
jgi:hypothetical protein